jgi:4-nitrophenyl phosphatase
MKSLTDIHSLLIDMDGVMYRGMSPIPGAGAFLEFARRRGVRFLLFTNNSSLTPKQYSEKLRKMDIIAAPEEVFTSCEATVAQLAKMLPPGAPVYIIGEDGIRSAIREAGYELTDKDVKAVVVGWDRQLTYDKIKTASLAIRRGALFIGTNPDLTYPAEEGIVPGNGASLAAIQAATSVAPFIVGKPELPIFHAALRRLQTAPEQVAIIGDRPETDILGGQRAKIMTILVMTGVSGQAELDASGLTPDWVFADLPALQSAWEKESRG